MVVTYSAGGSIVNATFESRCRETARVGSLPFCGKYAIMIFDSKSVSGLGPYSVLCLDE